MKKTNNNDGNNGMEKMRKSEREEVNKEKMRGARSEDTQTNWKMNEQMKQCM